MKNLFAGIFLMIVGCVPHQDTSLEPIAAELRSAPVVANGLVAGAPSEYNLVLRRKGVDPDRALDPQVNGVDIPPGGSLEIIHVEGFERVGDPVAANTNIILTTGPQNPIVSTAGSGPQHGDWRVEDDGAMTLTVVAHGAAGLSGGRAQIMDIKVIHVRPDPRSGEGPAIFRNGAMGTALAIDVRIRDAQGVVVAEGRATAPVTPANQPKVFISNSRLQTKQQGRPEVEAALIESVDFQRVGPGSRLDQVTSSGSNQAPTFILFAPASAQPDPFVPQAGIARVRLRLDQIDPARGVLVRDANDDLTLGADEPVIGSVEIKAPDGAAPRLLPTSSLTVSGDGSAAPNGSQLVLPIQVGEKTGRYALIVSLDGGNRATITTYVE